MARLSYVIPNEIDDPELRGWQEETIVAGKPGPETNRFGRTNRS